MRNCGCNVVHLAMKIIDFLHNQKGEDKMYNTLTIFAFPENFGAEQVHPSRSGVPTNLPETNFS